MAGCRDRRIFRTLFRNFISSKPNLDCNYTFPNDLAPNGISFGSKSIGNFFNNDLNLWLILQDSEYIFLCVPGMTKKMK